MKVQVHLVSTDKSSRIYWTGQKLTLDRTPHDISRGECFELYLTSDEEIKEGDKYLEDNMVRTAPRDFFGKLPKIVATTNKDLQEDKRHVGEFVDSNTYWIKGIPPIPESFIKLYIERYNTGNRILEVYLELED